MKKNISSLQIIAGFWLSGIVVSAALLALLAGSGTTEGQDTKTDSVSNPVKQYVSQASMVRQSDLPALRMVTVDRPSPESVERDEKPDVSQKVVTRQEIEPEKKLTINPVLSIDKTEPYRLEVVSESIPNVQIPVVELNVKHSVEPTVVTHTVVNPEVEFVSVDDTLESEHLSPVLIVFEKELVLEFPKSLATLQNVKRAMVRLVLGENPYFETDWLSAEPVVMQKRPFFFKQILDQDGNAMRYPYSVYRYAEYLYQFGVEQNNGTQGDTVSFQIPLTERKGYEPIEKYHNVVAGYASQFNISKDLVFAIMEVESSFNPKAVSRSNAMGLMQLKAEAAGKDVFKLIDSREGQPSEQELFDSENNIRMGTAYLGLLKHEYLASVRNKKSKELLAIASYNGGLSTVLALFADDKDKAVEKINRLHPKQVYRTLRERHESDETRRYIDKVLQAKDRYRQLLDDYV